MMPMAAQSIQRRAPGKVNLSLAVLGARDDGYHEIESWIVPIDWCDELIFEPAERFSLRIAGRTEGVPTDKTNLVAMAAQRLSFAAGRACDVGITLHKDLPAGAGLGGGSSDAAATLVALNDFWGLGWPIEKLLPIAAELGSDVPLFLAPHPVLVRGRGEIVDEQVAGLDGWLVLVVPPFALSTAEVYRAWFKPGKPAERMRTPWKEGTREGRALMRKLFNELEAAAFAIEPRLAELQRKIVGVIGQPVRMTGSGSALFTLSDDEAQALSWSEHIRRNIARDVEVRVARTLMPSTLVENDS